MSTSFLIDILEYENLDYSHSINQFFHFIFKTFLPSNSCFIRAVERTAEFMLAEICNLTCVLAEKTY